VAPGSRFERSSQDGGYEGASHCTVLARTAHRAYLLNTIFTCSTRPVLEQHEHLEHVASGSNLFNGYKTPIV
jgi:hypothetical protein